MSLFGRQSEELQEALIDAFPNTVLLEQMLLFKLEKNLKEIAGEGNLQNIVFQLIQTANAQGWIEDLVRGARRENPGNPRLRIIAEELLTGKTPQASSPNVPQEPSRSATIEKPRSTQQKEILVSGASILITFVLIGGGAIFLNFVTEKQPTFLPSPTNSTSPSKPSLSTPNQPPADDLSSEKGVNYTRLRDLLAAGNWKDADDETNLVMHKVVGRKPEETIKNKELLNFPCTDLRTIDSLWVKYSSGRFGFSVQKKIYLEVGAKLDGEYYEEFWDRWGDRVGWRVNQNWIEDLTKYTFDTKAPVGHLPAAWEGGGDDGQGQGWYLFSRAQTCQM